MKGREGYFRDWDHQFIMEMYTMTPKQKAEMADQWDIMTIGEAVPGAAARTCRSIAPARGERLHVRLMRPRRWRRRLGFELPAAVEPERAAPLARS